MTSIADTLHAASLNLQQQQISDSPKLDAELLLAFCLHKNRTYLYTWPEKTLSPTEQACFDDLVRQRLLGHPIAHLIGEREFWGLNLKVTVDTLIPRPDTEVLIETALDKLTTADNSDTQQTCSILDLGTGTGAIALALKSELQNCEVTAIDFSLPALKIAQQNAKTHNLDIHLVHSSWFQQLPSDLKFNLITSNPPYIEKQDPHLKEGDVRFEPISALTAGEDGLEDLRIIIDQAWSFLKTGGWLMVEHGYNQATDVQRLFTQHGYQQVETIQDYGQNPRITIGQKNVEVTPC